MHNICRHNLVARGQTASNAGGARVGQNPQHAQQERHNAAKRWAVGCGAGRADTAASAQTGAQARLASNLSEHVCPFCTFCTFCMNWWHQTADAAPYATRHHTPYTVIWWHRPYITRQHKGTGLSRSVMELYKAGFVWTWFAICVVVVVVVVVVVAGMVVVVVVMVLVMSLVVVAIVVVIVVMAVVVAMVAVVVVKVMVAVVMIFVFVVAAFVWSICRSISLHADPVLTHADPC